MVDQVRAVLDVESARKADEVGSSGRRNPSNISPSSFHKIAEKKLGLHAFKLRKKSEAEERKQSPEVGFLWQNKSQVYTLTEMVCVTNFPG